MLISINNPAVPSAHAVPGVMAPGRMVRVQGYSLPGADRFEINLQCGSSISHRDDIALHFNPRFPQRQVVRNHLASRSWGPEETSGGLPLERGKSFEVLILCEEKLLKVAVSGKHFCSFLHRIPYRRVTHLTVQGDVIVQLISFEGSQTVPCVHPIPGGMYAGRMVRVQGSIPNKADRFEINLQCGSSTGHRNDIALHINPRFPQHQVVRNHLLNRSWGPEETSGGMPFARGMPFDVLILCEEYALKVAVNGSHFCEFRHRLPHQCISHVTVEGDVTVHSVVADGAQAPQYTQPAYSAPPPAYEVPSYGAAGYPH